MVWQVSVTNSASHTGRWTSREQAAASACPRKHLRRTLAEVTAPYQGQTVVGRGLRERIGSVLAHELKPKRSKVSPFLVRQVSAKCPQTLIVVGRGELLEARIDFSGKQAH